LQLFVGAQAIAKYQAFPGGLFFTVNDPELLAQYAGQPIRFAIGEEGDIFESGGVVPEQPVKRRAVSSAAGDRDDDSAVLPTQRQLLER
jgi:hypothetical protein